MTAPIGHTGNALTGVPTAFPRQDTVPNSGRLNSCNATAGRVQISLDWLCESPGGLRAACTSACSYFLFWDRRLEGKSAMGKLVQSVVWSLLFAVGPLFAQEEKK